MGIPCRDYMWLILRIADKDEIARMERLPLMTGYVQQTDQDESENPRVFDDLDIQALLSLIAGKDTSF